MDQSKYIVKPVIYDVGTLLKWRASYKKSEGASGDYTTITDVDSLFDTEAAAAVYAHSLLVNKGIREDQITRG